MPFQAERTAIVRPASWHRMLGTGLKTAFAEEDPAVVPYVVHNGFQNLHMARLHPPTPQPALDNPEYSRESKAVAKGQQQQKEKRGPDNSLDCSYYRQQAPHIIALQHPPTRFKVSTILR